MLTGDGEGDNKDEFFDCKEGWQDKELRRAVSGQEGRTAANNRVRIGVNAF